MASPGLSLLQQVGIFADLEGGELEELAKSLRLRRYGKDEVICHRDDPGDSLFIIESGSVKVSLSSPDDREVILTFLATGESFGELALLDGEPRSVNVTSMEPSRLLSLPRSSFLSFLHDHPTATAALLASMSRQVRRLTDHVYDTAVLDLQTRIARALLKLSETAPSGADSPVLHMTQAQLGAIVGATRESVNKWLGFFERRGLIRRDKAAISILRADQLRTFARLESYVD